MENPAKEIADVVLLIAAAPSPEAQTDAVAKYFTEDASIRHPFCSIAPGQNSRDKLLAIYKWDRMLSPNTKVEIIKVTYNKESSEVWMEAIMTPHFRLSLFAPHSARVVVHLTLRSAPSPTEPKKTVYRISEQEDLFLPEDLTALLAPPLLPLVRLFLVVATHFNLTMYALLSWFQVWTEKEAGKGREVLANLGREPREALPKKGEKGEKE